MAVGGIDHIEILATDGGFAVRNLRVPIAAPIAPG
jgi:hypothetical protein